MYLFSLEKAKEALSALDAFLQESVVLVVGGGMGLMLAHQIPLATSDIDALPKGMSLAELDPLIKKVAAQLDLPVDWLNPYFSTFTHVLPDDYGTRLSEVFRGRRLVVQALGLEDMLIMKCFAHRQKDVGHVKAILKKNPDLTIVERQFDWLKKRRIPGVAEAQDFLDDVQDQMGGE